LFFSFQQTKVDKNLVESKKKNDQPIIPEDKEIKNLHSAYNINTLAD